MNPSQVDKNLVARLLSQEETGLEWESFSSDDWVQVVHLAEAEGVGPQLYWMLSRSDKISQLPKTCQDRLRAMFAATRMQNGQILHELETLASLFDQAGIPVVALKGICFALTIYPDLGIRPMVDLDLLVPAYRLGDAIEIAYSLGYEKAQPEARPGLEELLNHAICLIKRRAPFITFELHHTLIGEESFLHAVPVDWFWTQTEHLREYSVGWRAGNLLMLTPTAQVLYACAHAMLQHGGRNVSLRWMYDLDQTVRVHAENVDWELLLDQARLYKWSSAASAALLQVKSIFHTPVPKTILDKFAPCIDENTKRVVELQTFPGTHTLEEYQKIKSLTTQGRIKLILGLLVPSPAYMRWRYGLKNNYALPYSYLFRWCSIVKDGTQTMLHLIQS